MRLNKVKAVCPLQAQNSQAFVTGGMLCVFVDSIFTIIALRHKMSTTFFKDSQSFYR